MKTKAEIAREAAEEICEDFGWTISEAEANCLAMAAHILRLAVEPAYRAGQEEMRERAAVEAEADYEAERFGVVAKDIRSLPLTDAATGGDDEDQDRIDAEALKRTTREELIDFDEATGGDDDGES